MVITVGTARTPAQISLRCDGHHELVGMIPAVEGRHNRLALCSFQAEMPNNVKTTNRPVVLMTAPERKLNRQEHGIPLAERRQQQQSAAAPEVCCAAAMEDLELEKAKKKSKK